MRRVLSSAVLLLALLASSAPSVGAAPQTAVSVQIEVSATHVVAGSPLHVVVLVFNGASYAIKTRACSVNGLVEVGLKGAHYDATPFTAAPGCSRKYRLPTGLTRLALTVETTYDGCGTATRPCTAAHKPPPLPPGVYRAVVTNSGLPKSVPGTVSKPFTLT